MAYDNDGIYYDTSLPEEQAMYLQKKMEQDRKDMNKRHLLTALLLINLLIIGVLIFFWQLNLCYQEVSDSVWFCVFHAMGR